ncbi:MAG TPA: histidinol-phosphate transaminase [Candidatus Dormibacteraeota bacterium]|jgi:histidinol-phosphate aminotransferase|nr:histidinol-phosphate transaminase [Candidatus Dormibacteraeota bacterium]
MRIDRRELLRQFGTAVATSAFLPNLAEAATTSAEGVTHFVRLDRNENAYGPGEKAKMAFREALTEVNRYPDEDVEKLRAAIAASHGVKPENITLGCGSTELLRMSAEACLGPGKNLVMATPTFESIAHAAKLTGAEVRGTALTHEYAHDLNAMLARIDSGTGAVYICNPNDPTGTLTTKPEMEAFLAKVPAGVSVVIDEAYHDYVAPSGAYTSWAGRAASDARLIVTRTFSKVYGLAGLRVGYAISSVETAERLAERWLPGSINVVAARVALAALSDTSHVKKIITLNTNDRQEFFNQANARMLRCLDSETNFVLLRTFVSGKETAEILRGKGVLVRADYPGFEKHIRVSLGLPEDMRVFWSAWDAAMPHHPM